MARTGTLVWIIYDISDDGVRGRVARSCLEAGLYRVQKSVFLGTIERNRLDELCLVIERGIDGQSDSVYVFPLCQTDFDAVKVLGQGFDRALVSDRIGTLTL